MARVLFVVIAERGHLHPYLGTAARLARAGHTVAFYAPFDVRATLARAGFERFYGGHAAPPPAANRGAAFARSVRDPAWLRAWVTSLLVEQAPAQCEPLARAVDAFAPDVLACDPMVYAAPLVAGPRGLPWVGLSSSLNPVVAPSLDTPLARTIAALAPARDALFTERGLEPPRFAVCDALSPYGTGVFATEALVGPAPAGVSLLGPTAPLGPRGDEPDSAPLPARWSNDDDPAPRVYASFGSQVFHQPRLFALLRDACADLGARLLAAAGDLADDPLFAAPGCSAVRYAPQREALARARVFVTHAGANAVLEACSAGVPMLALPLCNDQHHNARIVRDAGLGLAREPDELTVDATREALASLLAREGPYAAAAARVARDYAARDGSARGAALVLAALEARGS